MNQDAIGWCPECGHRVVMRERRPDGNDTCEKGHTYPSAKSLHLQPPPKTRLADDSPSSLIVACDFDGTVVEHDYPEIGVAVPLAVETLRELRDLGARFILWTMRSELELAAAVMWFETQVHPLFGVNSNPTQSAWSRSPKAYAHVYIDDAAAGCPLMPSTRVKRPMVDWSKLRPHLIALAKARSA